ncbi:hypothetical protein LOTGIDRAFT_167491 [Lottia gigantea]|uniref:Uncharacterized protein n=1 Tax=Lottia gigantea TaxID=225164 RepID=V3ZTV4_LOTGI|nr:hypothetical protein LOTGIDRAFT_167491 [Lottia gigantea]ESO85995.1 hypothetical protein LOTGIDRAFT_167491 [Lottia gigantea]
MTDAHYSVLSVLLDLSDCPTETVFTEKKQVTEESEEEEFNWGEYLLEGVDTRRYYFSDTSDEEEEESEEEELAVINQSELETVAEISDARCTLDKVKDWLERNLVVQYWIGRGNEQESIGRFPTSNLHTHW